MKTAANLINEIEKEYLNRMTQKINMLFEDLKNNTWLEKKSAIVTNSLECFDYLIIPDSLLKEILTELPKYHRFKNIQKELLSALEINLRSEIEAARKEHEDYLTSLTTDIDTLAQSCNKQAFFEYTTVKDTLFIPNNYFKERLDFLQEILNSQVPLQLNLNSYELSIKELINKKILLGEHAQKATKDITVKKDILSKIYDIYDKMIFLKYNLSTYINPEIIFALGFIDDSLLFNEATILRRLVLHHTQMFKDMIDEMPIEMQKYFSLKDIKAIKTYINNNNNSINNMDIFIYQRVSDLYKVYFSQEKNDGLYFYNSTHFNRYWNILKEVFTETFLIFPDIVPKNYTNLGIYFERMRYTYKDIAEIFNTSQSTVFRIINNPKKITPEWVFILGQFLDFNLDFLRGTITIPSLGHWNNDKYLIAPILYSKKTHRSILETYKRYLEGKMETTTKSQFDDSTKYLFKHLNLLISNINNLKKEDVEAIDRLLGFEPNTMKKV